MPCLCCSHCDTQLFSLHPTLRTLTHHLPGGTWEEAAANRFPPLQGEINFQQWQRIGARLIDSSCQLCFNVVCCFLLIYWSTASVSVSALWRETDLIEGRSQFFRQVRGDDQYHQLGMILCPPPWRSWWMWLGRGKSWLPCWGCFFWFWLNFWEILKTKIKTDAKTKSQICQLSKLTKVITLVTITI